MRERPILYSAPMVRANLRAVDPKTQTRRVVNPQPSEDAVRLYVGDIIAHDIECSETGGHLGFGFQDESRLWLCPYGKPGDRLWCRETFFAFGRWEMRFSAKKKRDEWHFVDMTIATGHAYSYAADGGQPLPMRGRRDAGVTPGWWKRPAIFMPRAASRTNLLITSVRVERLQAITNEDAAAEGVEYLLHGRWRDYLNTDISLFFDTPRDSYRSLWQMINGTESWDSNPWVWVVDYKRLEA